MPLLNHRFHTAIFANDERALSALLQEGADPEAFTDDETGPELNALMMAAKRGAPAMVEILLSASNPQARNAYGVSALQWAAIGGCALCVSLLLAAGIDPNSLDRRGENALMDAAGLRNIDCVEILLPLTDDPMLIGGANKRSAIDRAISGLPPSSRLGLLIAELIAAEPSRREAEALEASIGCAPPTRAPFRM